MKTVRLPNAKLKENHFTVSEYLYYSPLIAIDIDYYYYYKYLLTFKCLSEWVSSMFYWEKKKKYLIQKFWK